MQSSWEIYERNGVAKCEFTSQVTGWGSGYLIGTGSAHNVVQLKTKPYFHNIKLYAPGKVIPAGTEVKIWGVRA
jgi:hypothetical protein